MKNLLNRLQQTDRGAALALVGASLLLLLGMAAFGSDLAWFYLNSSRIQRAADAAALGGVVHLPFDESTAKTNAQSIAVQNGYTHGVDSNVVTDVDSDDSNLGPTEMRVTISADVPTFFLKAFGWNTQRITETARAEYVPPLPMGSPDNQFGDSPGCWEDPKPAGCRNHWASIQGHYNGRGYGDYYSSRCLNWSNCTYNNDYRDRGYLYGVEVGAGVSSFTLELLNPSYTGPNPMEERNPYGRSLPNITYTLYNPTTTPLNLSSTSPIGGSCTQSYGPGPWPGDANVDWQVHCTVSSAVPGIYPFQVQIPSGDTSAHARYSIRATTASGSGSNPAVFALGDMSIYTANRGVSEFYLADVQPYHAGNTLVIELWDAGDAYGDPVVQVVGPGGTTYDCAFSSTNTNHTGISPGCAKTTRFQGNTTWGCLDCFNNNWMTFRVTLPDTYTCSDCWWKMRYTYPTSSQITDTTTWRAYIEGNPIHLVPNE